MAIVLIHGALGNGAQLHPLADLLGQSAPKCIELTGHGASELPAAGLSFERFVADIEQEIPATGRIHLFGYSMGGYAALLFAAKHPERVASVATLGTKFLWDEAGLQRELRMLDPDVMVEKVPAFAKKLAAMHGELRWRKLVSATAKSMAELAASPLLTDAVIARIECPVLLCVGDADATAVVADTQAFAQLLKQHEVAILPNTRHAFDGVDLELLTRHLKKHWAASEE